MLKVVDQKVKQPTLSGLEYETLVANFHDFFENINLLDASY